MGIPLLKLLNNEKKVILDPISNICILGTFMLFAVDMFIFLPNVNDHPEAMELVLRSAISFAFLIGGLIGMLFMGVHIPVPQTKGGNVDLNLSQPEWAMISMLFMVNMMAIVTINILTKQYSTLFSSTFVDYPDSPFRWAIFSTAIGWTEEVVFRGFLQTSISRISGSVVGILASTVAWVAFHGGVYNLDPTVYTILFLIGLVLSITFHISNYRLSVTMLPHGLNNFIAVGSSANIALGAIAKSLGEKKEDVEDEHIIMELERQ